MTIITTSTTAPKALNMRKVCSVYYFVICIVWYSKGPHFALSWLHDALLAQHCPFLRRCRRFLHIRPRTRRRPVHHTLHRAVQDPQRRLGWLEREACGLNYRRVRGTVAAGERNQATNSSVPVPSVSFPMDDL